MTDRELDALVAKKVMGWADIGPRVTADGCNEVAGRPPGNLPNTLSYVPSYSTTGDGMLDVIEKMRERGFSVGVQWSVFGGPHAVVAQEPEGPVAYIGPVGVFKASAGSLPRAVCLAALKALGEEVK